MEIIVGKQGSQKISITDPMVSRQHCRLTEQTDGTFLLEDLNSANGTFVNGTGVIRTVVDKDTIIRLGPSYEIKVADLVAPAEAPKQGKEMPTFSIAPMQKVWDDYQQQLSAIKEQQKSIANLRMISPIFTMGSGSVATVAKFAGWGDVITYITAAMTLIGFGLTAFAFVKGKKDDSDERKKEATEYFQLHYYCPNPKCQRTHSQSPKVLLHNKKCPYCHCEYTE